VFLIMSCWGCKFPTLVEPALARRYERAFIEAWLSQHPSCPTTGQRLQRPVPIIPVYALRSTIEKWARDDAPWLQVRPARAAGAQLLWGQGRVEWGGVGWAGGGAGWG
jgi:hypothetical protein